MNLKPHSVYGFADHNDVKDAIAKRLNSLNGNKDVLYNTLQEAVQTLLEINEVVPVSSRHRHLVANALERFANGTSNKNPHPESTAA